MSGYDQPMATSGESEYVMNPESPSTHKRASILGKLKDKTRKAGSRIKSKVGKKKNADGTDTPVVDGEEHEEEEEERTSDDSPSPASPASPAVTTAPRELGSAFESEPSRYGSGNGAAKEDSIEAAVPDMSGLSLDDSPAAKDEPSFTTDQKAFEAPEGVKDSVTYDDGAGATAGALGVDEGAAFKEPESEDSKPDSTEKAPESEEMPVCTEKAPESEEMPVSTEKAPESEEMPVSTEKTSELASEGVGAKTEEIGDGLGYDAADDKGSEVAEQRKETTSESSEVPISTDTAESKAMETEEAADQSVASEAKVESKEVEDVNNATDGSETYTEEADNAAVDAKDTVGDTSEQAPEGPSMVEKAKEALGVAKPSEEDQVKETVDTTKDQTTRTGDDASAATEESTGISAPDTTKDHTAPVVDAATPKQEDKGLGEKIGEALGAVPAKASDTAASVTETARSPTTTTPGTLTHAPAAHSSDPASPGIMGMIGGLFGFGAKAPEDHAHSHDAKSH